jgi:cysteine desulfurase
MACQKAKTQLPFRRKRANQSIRQSCQTGDDMRKVYLDNISATPLLPEVREAMLPYLGELFGNPSSLHDWGDPAREAVGRARSQVAGLIGVNPEELIFTASGSESNNLAVKGLALAQQAKGKHILLSAIEHFSVLNAAKTLQKLGFEYELIPVDARGLVDPAEVKRRLRPDTTLVSVMLANSEVGTLEPVAEIAGVTKAAGVLFHTDAVAAVGQVPIQAEVLGVDALSLAGDQFNGPKGSGALWLRHGVRLAALIDGGIQEGGRRAGTENVPALAGLGKAAEMARIDLEARSRHLTGLRDRLLTELPARIPHTLVTGHHEQRLPGHASFCIEFIEGESMLMLLNSQGVAVSSGSACTSRALKASHVLIAMGLSHEVAQGSIVFSFGLDNTLADVDYVLEVLPPIVTRLRQMSPLYDTFLKTGQAPA